MRRIVAAILATLILLSSVGCSSSKQQDSVVDTYITMANQFVEEKDYEQAIAILEEGVKNTKNAEIEKLLESVKAMQDRQNPTNETTTTPEQTTTHAEAVPQISNYPIQIDMDDMLSANILGETFYSAYEKGFLESWMFLYVHGDSEPETIYDEFWFDTQLNQMTYYGILEKQAQDAGWSDIWTKMVSEYTSQEANSNSGTQNDFASYAGTWAEEGIGWEYGGMIMDVECTDETIKVTLSYTQRAPTSRIAEITIEEKISNIKDGVLVAELVEDGWGNKSTVQINLFIPDLIQCRVVEVVPDQLASWGFYEGLFELYRNDSAHESMFYVIGDYYELYPEEAPDYWTEAELTYDSSKASGILATLGMSEQEFRESCQPLFWGSSNKIICTKDLREYPANYIGQHFYFSYSSQDKSGNYKSEKLEIFAKEVSDGYTAYEIYSLYEGKDYIIIFDLRDDVYSPTISMGDYICPYLIFLGIETIGNFDCLCFSMISVEK